MITLSIILAVVIVTSFFVIRNLIKQAEKLEDIQVEYEKFINKQSEAINICNERLKQIDSRGIFKSDDEIGFMYEQIKELQRILSKFRVDKL